jgi:uncharacterized protein (DUF433 family)
MLESDMEKTAIVTPDLLNTIESRLLRLEAMLREVLSLSGSNEIWGPRWLALRQQGNVFMLPGIDLSPEMKAKRLEARETSVEPWQFLVRRHHPWRKQLYIKGCNMTARQLAGSIIANQLDEETAAANYHVSLEAVREALTYVEQNRELLETEAEIERLMHRRGGGTHAPRTVSG